jgi:hypothetical protein
MTLHTRPRRWFRGSIFHVQWPRMKHEENSNRGDREANRRGKRGTDIDLTISEADPKCPLHGDPEHGPGDTCRGHILRNHWLRALLRDRFRDPLKKIARRARIDRLTWPQIHRLVAVTRGKKYRISRIRRALLHCARLGLVAVLEPKGDPRLKLDWPWEYIFAVAEDVGCTIAIRALPENKAALATAKRVATRSGVHVETWEIR